MARRNSEIKDISTLKARVKELEDQLSEYKRRLDDLRKAKNTTIFKRERQVVNVSAPDLGRRDSLSKSDSSKIRSLESQLEELKIRHKRQIDDLKNDQAKVEVTCNHEAEIFVLRTKVNEIMSENAALLFENEGLKDQICDLQSQLSIKEASLCDREEKLKIQVEKEWQQRYQEWMARTEQKLEELQHANNLMRTLLKKPPGRDPSGQDPI